MKKRAWITIILFILCFAYFTPKLLLPLRENFFQNYYKTVQSELKKEQKEVVLNSGNYVIFGSYLNEPIVWKVADVNSDGKALLVSDKIICFKAFDSCGEKKDYCPAEDVRKFGSSDWEKCTLKEWLNSSEQIVSYSHCPPAKNFVYNGFNAYDNEAGFLYESNFSNNQKALISDEGVFIPSKTMIQNHIKTHEIKKRCTDTAMIFNNSVFLITRMQSVWYWTSTAYRSNNVSVTTVTSSGTFYKTLAYDSTTGVCPALYLKTKVIISLSGNGSKDSPYIIY